ncbi:MAG: BolA/IbaG family iron-sulfur metabolism protein, partial [Alphaproteobacteria bacterium]|nr:BolA/IbaG family iron-sulfur metabolism protein [Alphaproteobacteria bacterium]
LSRVQRQRLVHAVLAQEMAGPLHALSMQLYAPDEAGEQKIPQ